jgi:large repetitive protein
MITYQICDVTGLCDTATVTITIDPAADSPIANNDSTSTAQAGIVTFVVTANDTDGDGNLEPTTVTILTGPTVGSATNNGDGTITIDYSASPLFTGTETITYRVCDATSPVPLCDTATLSITVDDTPQPPTAVIDLFSTNEDTPATFDLADNDTDPDGNLDPTTLTIISGPSHGTAVDNLDGTIDYTPTPDYAGPDSITYQVCDLTGLCDTATVSITVDPIDDDPEARPDTAATAEDTAITINLAANDTDPDGDLAPATLVILSPPTAGSVVNHLDGTVTYTPGLDSFAADSLTYRICDAGGNCDTSIVTISVVAVNDLPEPVDDTFSIDEDTSAVFDLASNDTDPDGILDLDPTTLTILSGPSHGTAVNNLDGTIDYTPGSEYSGPDTITYQICDTDGECATATVTITVDPVADPPVATPDGAAVAEDGSVTVDVAVNDLDVDGNLDPTAVTILTPPVSGTATVNLDGTITYDPNTDFSGGDTLTYRICDDTSPIPLCDSAVLTLAVSASDDPPVADPDGLNVDEDGSETLDVTIDDTDPDGDLVPASVSILLDPFNGTAVANGDGTVTYTPQPNFAGADSFVYQVCDATALCASATVSVVVDPLPDPPVAVDDTATVAEDGAVTIDLAFNDADPDGDLLPATVTIVSGPSLGTATVNGDGTLTYSPDPDLFGTDSLIYEICDGTSPTPLCAQASLDLTITPAADLPVALDDTASVPEDGSVTIDVLANDGDVDGDLDPTTVVVTSPPANGTVVVDPDTGDITYLPTADWSGTDTFVYQVCDAGPNCVFASVEVSVSPENDPPVAADFTVTGFEDLPHTADVSAQVTDIDGVLDFTSVRIISGPAHGSVIVDPLTGAITYSANPDFAGTDALSYLICDLAGACDSGIVTFVVAAVNDAPRLVVDHLDLQVGNSFTSIVLVDPETDVFSAGVLAGTVPPGMALAADGTLTGTPTVSGTYQLTLESCDVLGACSVTVLSIRVAVAALGLLPFTGFALTSLGGSGLGLLLLGWVLARRSRGFSRPARNRHG